MAKVELLKRDRQPLSSYARHYSDLFQLSGHTEIQTMLASAEYATIKEDYDQISRAHFPKSYFFLEGMSFARSDALLRCHLRQSLPLSMKRNAECFARGLTRHGKASKLAFWKYAISFSANLFHLNREALSALAGLTCRSYANHGKAW